MARFQKHSRQSSFPGRKLLVHKGAADPMDSCASIMNCSTKPEKGTKPWIMRALGKKWQYKGVSEYASGLQEKDTPFPSSSYNLLKFCNFQYGKSRLRGF